MEKKQNNSGVKPRWSQPFHQMPQIFHILIALVFKKRFQTREQERFFHTHKKKKVAKKYIRMCKTNAIWGAALPHTGSMRYKYSMLQTAAGTTSKQEVLIFFQNFPDACLSFGTWSQSAAPPAPLLSFEGGGGGGLACSGLCKRGARMERVSLLPPPPLCYFQVARRRWRFFFVFWKKKF